MWIFEEIYQQARQAQKKKLRFLIDDVEDNEDMSMCR